MTSVQWTEITNFLMSGHPPVLYLLLGLNGIFLTMYVRRKLAAQPRKGGDVSALVQIGILGANLAVLFRDDVQRYLSWAIGRI